MNHLHNNFKLIYIAFSLGKLLIKEGFWKIQSGSRSWPLKLAFIEFYWSFSKPIERITCYPYLSRYSNSPIFVLFTYKTFPRGLITKFFWKNKRLFVGLLKSSWTWRNSKTIKQCYIFNWKRTCSGSSEERFA